MNFKDQLNQYIDELNITQKDLAEATGLSAATISRYLNGTREPEYDSEHVKQLAEGLAKLGAQRAAHPQRAVQAELAQQTAQAQQTRRAQQAAQTQSGMAQIVPGEESVLSALNDSLSPGLSVDYPVFLSNLVTLLESLNIRNSELARGLNYDASHISKILSGSRRPGNMSLFIEGIASHIARRYSDPSSLHIIAGLTCNNQDDGNQGDGNQDDGNPPAEITPDAFHSQAELRDHIAAWLGTNTEQKTPEPISHFLEKIDEFDLNEYMKAIHFDEMKIPPSIPHLPVSKTYYGIKDMMESELDFMKTTVLSRSKEDCILYSDMPLEEMASDPDFPKKWMFGMAMMLKKGLHLHIIHDVNRPFPEMMLGLEGNLPMYMTGQISPYYFPSSQSNVFNHFLKVSGAAALEGCAIAGKQSNGKYVLYRSKEDIRHYRQRAQDMLNKARPLMEIYRSDRKDLYQKKRTDLLRNLQNEDLRTVCSSLPLYTLSEALLEHILSSSHLSEENRQAVRDYHTASRRRMLSLLEEHHVTLEVPALSRAQFDASPVSLALSDLFIETDVPYSYEDYTAHLNETTSFAAGHPNLTIEQNPRSAFHNVSFTIHGKKAVIVSKEKSPTIHFVIHHKMMVQAFLNFIPPIVEDTV